MNRIIPFMLLLLISAQPSQPPPKEDLYDKIVDGDIFTHNQLFHLVKRGEAALAEIPPSKINDDVLARYYYSEEPTVFFFRKKSDNQVLILQTITDYNRADVYYFKLNNITPEIEGVFEAGPYPYRPPYPSDAEIEIHNKKAFIKKKIIYAPIVADKYFTTKKGVKLGMTYKEVIKIYGKPKEQTFLDHDKTKKECFWKISDPYIGELKRATLYFVNNRVERIHFSYNVEP